MRKKQILSTALAAVIALSNLTATIPAFAENHPSAPAEQTETAAAVSASKSGISMYRLYNSNSGEHFYTASSAERNRLIAAGWDDEGIGWIAPAKGKPVYRLYNRHAGDHHYTTSVGERNALIKAGWKNEGVGWYSGGSLPLYRQYNPHAKSGSHNYTTSKPENDALVRAGWKGEGIAWYATGAGSQPANNIASVIRKIPVSDGSNFYFASGVGAWGTELLLKPDGTFSGTFSDHDMSAIYPGGEMAWCEFSGRFTNFKYVNSHTWRMTLSSLTTKQKKGTQWVSDDTHYTASIPYGLENGKTFYLYTPGYKISSLPSYVADWVSSEKGMNRSSTADFYTLYSVEEQYPFTSFSSSNGL